MARLNNTDGFKLHGWMVNELGLGGGELITFALVYQMTTSKCKLYKGGVSYLCRWLGCSGNTTRKYLRDLEAKGLIKSKRGVEKGVPYCHYRVAPRTLQKFKDTPSKTEGEVLQNLKGGTSKFEGGDTSKTEERSISIGPIKGSIKGTTHPSREDVAAFVITLGFADPAGFADDYVTYNEDRNWIVEKTHKPILNWKNHIRNNCAWAKDKVYQAAASTSTTTNISIDI